jgi:hypothetical protein
VLSYGLNTEIKRQPLCGYSASATVEQVQFVTEKMTQRQNHQFKQTV